MCVSGVQWGDGQLTYKKMKVGVVRGVWGRKGGEVGPLAGPKNPWFCYQQGGKSGSWVKSMSFEGGPPNLLLPSPNSHSLPTLIKWPAQSRLPASPPVASECTPYLCCARVCCLRAPCVDGFVMAFSDPPTPHPTIPPVPLPSPPPTGPLVSSWPPRPPASPPLPLVA